MLVTSRCAPRTHPILRLKIYRIQMQIAQSDIRLDQSRRQRIHFDRFAMPATNVEDDPYAHAAKGALKLKSDPTVSKKKKNKDEKKKKLVEVSKIIEEEKPLTVEIKRTKAELAFQKMQEKMQTERIKEKASKTHKQRVEEFNRHLDSLTEHFDIPKVSWTK